MVLGSGILMVLLQKSVQFYQALFLISVGNLIFCTYIFYSMPEFTQRLRIWMRKQLSIILRNEQTPQKENNPDVNQQGD